MRRTLVLIAALVFVGCLVPGQALGSDLAADRIIRSPLGETILKDAVIQSDGVDYVPLQEIASAFGAAAYWIQDAIVMRLLTENQSVELTVSNYVALVDGQPVELDMPPIKVDGRVHLSINALTWLLGVDADGAMIAASLSCVRLFQSLSAWMSRSWTTADRRLS